MSLFTDIDEVRESVESGLGDSALTILWNDAEQAVEQKLGAVSSQEDEFVTPWQEFPLGRDRHLVLTRKASSITSVSEQWANSDATALSADDYELQGYRRLERLQTGTNARQRWGHKVTVTYVPLDDTARRKTAILKLIQVAEKYEGAKAIKAGDYSETLPEYNAARNAIIHSLIDQPF